MAEIRSKLITYSFQGGKEMGSIVKDRINAGKE